jgi:iron complex outermembrane recepter protein
VQLDPTGLYTSVGFPNVSYAKSETDHDLSPTASVSYQFMPGVMGYTRFARGFKSAAYNVDLVPSTSGLSAGPEHATTDEIGVKSDWFGHRLRANLAAFDTHYVDLQVSQLLGSGVTLNNAGKASIRGYEAELAGYLIRDFKLEGSMGYLDAKYDRYSDCTIPISLGGGATDCSGNRIVGAPKYTFHTAAEYERPLAGGSFIARLDYNVQSPVFFTAYNTNRFASDWRHVLDARVGVSGLGASAHWDFFVWGKNLTNDSYVVYRDDRSNLGVLQTTAYGDPRTYGVSIGAHF